MKNISVFLVLIFLGVVSNAQIGIDDSTSLSNGNYNQNDSVERVTIRTKAVYNIAYILPIQQHKIKLGDGKKVATFLPYRVKEVLGFWEGAVIALNESKNYDSIHKFNLHIWDNYKNDSVTAEILKQIDNYEIDAVISPFYTKRAIMVSNYCKSKGIPFFLAQNPSDVPVKNNSNSFKFHVPLNRTFYKYYNKINNDISYKNSNNVLIYDMNSKSQRRLKNYINYKSKKDSTNNIFSVPYYENMNIAEIIDSTKKNVLFVSMYKTEAVNEMLSNLTAYGNYDIEILGHNLWLNNNKIKFDSNHTYVVYSDFFIDNNIAKVESIKEQYLKLTGDNITFQSFQGYDVTKYIIEIFNRFGLDFPKYMDTYKYYGAVSNIHMKPIYKSNGNLVFYENTSRMLLKRYGKEWLKIEY